MQKSEKFFIFSWKELVVIGLLILTSLGFFFTLGLHYGKKLKPAEAPLAAEVQAPKLEESPESVPPKEALDQGSQHTESVAQEAIKASTEEAVQENKLKVENPRPVDLPKEKAQAKEEAPHAEAEEESSESSGKFAIQLGSYPNRKEAQLRVKALNKRGLKPEVRTALVKGETRYRVVIPGFKSKPAADQRGRELRAKRKIENFVTIKAE